VSNTLSAYNPIFYASEALIALEKALGMANRVYRKLDQDKGREPGDTITIRRPSVFTALNAPTTAQDLTAGSASVLLNKWKEVKFGLTDQELTYTGERIVAEHIRPAAYALADAIDQSLCALWSQVPWISNTWTSTSTVADILTARQKLFDNAVPMNDLHFMVDGKREAELLGLTAFSQFQGSGPLGAETQITGSLGTRYGIEFFANQNVASKTSATVADLAGSINNGPGYVAGTKSILVTGFAAAAVLTAGDVVVITGHTQQYVLTAGVTLDGSGAGTLAIDSFNPGVQGGGLESAVINTQVVTITLSGGSGATKFQTLAFNRNAFALAMAPLSMMGNGRGAEIFVAQDPITGLSVRARLFYDGNNSKMFVSLDALWGVLTLNGNLATRVLGA
jgi:hypothetical protein